MLKGYKLVKVEDLKNGMILAINPKTYYVETLKSVSLEKVRDVELERFGLPDDPKNDVGIFFFSYGDYFPRGTYVLNKVEVEDISELDLIHKEYEDVQLGEHLPIPAKALGDNLRKGTNIIGKVVAKKPSHRTIDIEVGKHNIIRLDFYKNDKKLMVILKEETLDKINGDETPVITTKYYNKGE